MGPEGAPEPPECPIRVRDRTRRRRAPSRLKIASRNALRRTEPGDDKGVRRGGDKFFGGGRNWHVRTPADDAGAVMKLYHPWTDLNVHRIEPVMTFAALKAIVAEEY